VYLVLYVDKDTNICVQHSVDTCQQTSFRLNQTRKVNRQALVQDQLKIGMFTGVCTIFVVGYTVLIVNHLDLASSLVKY